MAKSRDKNLLTILLCVLSGLAGMWLQSATATAARPIQSVPLADDSMRPIPKGHEDVRGFFKTIGFDGQFQLLRAQRDELLGRRYYRVQLEPRDVAALREKAVSGWTYGRFSRAVYENNVSARVPRSRNLPTWWSAESAPEVTQIMLDHGGNPMWYLVLSRTGDACLMWVGR